MPTDNLSDGTLVTAVLAGEDERFELLVARYRGALVRVALSRLGRGDWAEEAVQETFLCAFKSLHTYNSRYSFRTWLWTILLNQCRRHLQKRRRRPQVHAWSDQPAEEETTSVAAHLIDSEPSPAAKLLAKERSHVLESVLRRLPAAQADALRLRFFGELKFQEIADTMGCSLSTAKQRVRWGLTKMSQLMAPKEAWVLGRNTARPADKKGRTCHTNNE